MSAAFTIAQIMRVNKKPRTEGDMIAVNARGQQQHRRIHITGGCGKRRGMYVPHSFEVAQGDKNWGGAALKQIMGQGASMHASSIWPVPTVPHAFDDGVDRAQLSNGTAVGWISAYFEFVRSSTGQDPFCHCIIDYLSSFF